MGNTIMGEKAKYEPHEKTYLLDPIVALKLANDSAQEDHSQKKENSHEELRHLYRRTQSNPEDSISAKRLWFRPWARLKEKPTWLRSFKSFHEKRGSSSSSNNNNDSIKRLKAQHLESFDYDSFESRVNLQHDYELTESTIRSLNLGRWIMTFSIGLFTGLVACFIEVFSERLCDWRQSQTMRILQGETSGALGFGSAFLMYAAISMAFVAIASSCVALACPVAGGSGISEIKATLNGIKIHRVVRFKTLVCKAFGVLFSVAGGLPVGKEGPMIHSGAIIGAGLSQGKSSSFGLDTSWTKFKGFRNDKEKRDFISSGAAAGVAAAFGAPIGGVLFALEEGASFWHQNLTWRTFFCAMVSAFVLNLFLTFKQGVAWGALGTQSGTFSFGTFGGSSKSYACGDVVVFTVMGVAGGVFGAWFNWANTKLTTFRMKYLGGRWVKLGEALVIALVMASVSFWLSYYAGTCLPMPNAEVQPYAQDLVSFYCPPGVDNQVYYNDLASLFTVNYGTSIKQLLHFSHDHENASEIPSFTPQSLLVFFVAFYLVACLTYGIAVPSGLFVPSLLAGAAYGRLCVYFIHWIGLPITAPDGMFALIGRCCVGCRHVSSCEYVNIHFKL